MRTNNERAVLTKSLARKVAKRKLVEVKVKDLEINPLQPSSRLNRDAPKYKELLASIGAVGVLDHLHYSSATMHTFDGHRRTLALEDLGVPTVLAYRYDGLTKKEEQILFRYLNTTNLRFSRKQQVATYLAGGDADGLTVKACANAFNTGEHLYGNGQKFLHKIASSKICVITLHEATTGFISYIRKDDKFDAVESDVELRAMVYKYCTNVDSPYHIKQLLWKKPASPERLYNHIKSMKPIRTETVLVD